MSTKEVNAEKKIKKSRLLRQVGIIRRKTCSMGGDYSTPKSVIQNQKEKNHDS